MGAAQSIPIVGEVVTVVDAGVRAGAALVCEAVGRHDSAVDLIEGAENTLKHYVDVNLIVSNTRYVIAKVEGDNTTADYLLKKEGEAWTEIAENTPIVGHVVGAVRYIEGDREGGDRAMIGASRSAVVAGVAIATGGLGAVAAAGAAAATGLAADAAVTAGKSLVEHKYSPVGTIAGVTHAINTGSPSDWVTALEMPAGDAAAGALEGAVKVRLQVREPLTAAQMAERESLTGSIVENYTRYTEVADAAPQIPLADLRASPQTANIVREFASPREALSALEPGQR